MSEEPGRSWLARLADAFQGEPETRDDLIAIIRDAGSRGLVDPEAQQIIEATLKVSERQVREIMIPRGQMVVLRDDEPLEAFLPRMMESKHSRFPVLSADNSDEALGIVLAKDLLRLVLTPESTFTLRDGLRPVLFVPESTHLDKLIRDFRSQRSHMAIVVNEYGGIAGLVTLEDALEQIVGDIDDEHDIASEEDTEIQVLGEQRWRVQAQINISDFNEHFATSYRNEDCETMAGLLLQAFERLPSVGELIQLDGLRFTIEQTNGRRLETLIVERA